MDPSKTIRGIVLRLNNRRNRFRSSVHLTISPRISNIPGNTDRFRELVERFLQHVLTVNNPAAPVKVVVHIGKRKTDLEKFFSMSPSYWLHLRIEGQADVGFEGGAIQTLDGLGYRCPEWVGVEGSESQLGAFYTGTQVQPSVILFAQNRGSRRSCDLLIPIIRRDQTRLARTTERDRSLDSIHCSIG